VRDPGTEQRKCARFAEVLAPASRGLTFPGALGAVQFIARVVCLHFLSTCCSHAALTICDWSSDTLLKLTYGTMSALDTSVVTNDRHDSLSSLDRHDGHAKAMHSTVAKGFCPPSCSRRICVSNTAVPAPNECPTTVSVYPGLFIFAATRSCLHVFTSHLGGGQESSVSVSLAPATRPRRWRDGAGSWR
jgi:hypothetical protein